MAIKTLKQLEREWARYVARTRRKRKHYLKRPAPVTAILSRRVTTVVGGKALWGDFKRWGKYSDNARNLKAAIRDALGYLNRRHIGTIVYVALRGSKDIIPLWQAKWGHDGIPFTAWKANPVAVWWRGRVK